METLKLGSKGDSVKQLQKALNLTVDGDFGPKTELAVKQWQKEQGLTVDGIVGEKTWNLLISNSKAISSEVIYKPLPIHVTPLNNRDIKFLVIHFTAGSNSKPGKALSEYNTFVERAASADFVVDDRDIVQCNPDIKNYYCWAAGDSLKNTKGGSLYKIANNKNIVSIELCSTCIPATSTAVNTPNHNGWSFAEDTLNNAIKIAKIIMGKYNIPITNVIRHYDITGKICPGIIGWNTERINNLDGTSTNQFSDDSKWQEFKNKLK